MEELTKYETIVKKGNFNIMMTFAVRYALERQASAPMTMRRIIHESLDSLNYQTEEGIIRDIEDYISEHEVVPNMTDWSEIMVELRDDAERKKHNYG